MPSDLTATRDVQLSAFPGIQADKPVGKIVGSVQTGTNADLIAKVAPLYLTGSVLDVTYGEGKWWDRYRPDDFTFHDLHKVDGVDFRNLPHDDGSFDAVCFDPPYVISGGRSTGRMAGSDFQDRYGIGGDRLKMTNSEGGNAALHDLMQGGLTEAIRVSRRWVLVKCMEFAQGGGVNNAFGSDFHDAPYAMTKWALDLGAIKHDQIVHNCGAGPGGHNVFTPRRARREHSYLIVFRVPAAVDLAGAGHPAISGDTAAVPIEDVLADGVALEVHEIAARGTHPDSHLDPDLCVAACPYHHDRLTNAYGEELELARELDLRRQPRT